jgi:hypothetical protein
MIPNSYKSEAVNHRRTYNTMAKEEKHNNVSSGLQNTRIIKQHIFSFIGGGNRNTQRKPPTCRRSLTNFIT